MTVWLVSLVVTGMAVVVTPAGAVPGPGKTIAALKRQVVALTREVTGLKSENAALKTTTRQLQLVPQLAAIAAATGPYRDVQAAVRAGYQPDGTACDPRDGIHYLNPQLLADPALDPLRPEALVYNPTPAGLRLVAAQYIAFNRGQTVLGQQMFGPVSVSAPLLAGKPFYFLNLWLWKFNPTGLFYRVNPTVTCGSA